MTDHVSAREAIRRVPAGATLVCTVGCGTPTTLLEELAAAPTAEPRHLYSGLLLGGYPFLDALAQGALRYTTWLAMPPIRSALAAGQASYLPLAGSEVPGFLATLRPDVGLARISPPDRHGYVSLGPSVGYSHAVLTTSRLRIGEIDPALPRTHGRSLVHASAFDILTESTSPTPIYASRPPTELSRRIAANILELVPRDAVLQLGIGAIPEALTTALADADLGRLRFVGMGTDAMVPLIEDGVAPASTVPAPTIAAVELMGSDILMAFADDNPVVGVYPADGELHPERLGELPRFTTINSALEIDLAGQASAEAAGARVIAGIGGSADFVAGATRSDGGVRIIALSATGSPPAGSDVGPSRIVPALASGSPVTHPHFRVDHVVTEFGYARISGRTLEQRAEALIGVAHPDHRDTLADSVFARPTTTSRTTR